MDKAEGYQKWNYKLGSIGFLKALRSYLSSPKISLRSRSLGQQLFQQICRDLQIDPDSLPGTRSHRANDPENSG